MVGAASRLGPTFGKTSPCCYPALHSFSLQMANAHLLVKGMLVEPPPTFPRTLPSHGLWFFPGTPCRISPHEVWGFVMKRKNKVFQMFGAQITLVFEVNAVKMPWYFEVAHSLQAYLVGNH